MSGGANVLEPFRPGSLFTVELSPVEQVVGAIHSSHSVRPGKRESQLREFSKHLKLKLLVCKAPQI